MRSTTCNGNAVFAENKVYNLYNLNKLYTYMMKIRGLSVEDLRVEKSSTPPVWIFSEIACLK